MKRLPLLVVLVAFLLLSAPSVEAKGCKAPRGVHNTGVSIKVTKLRALYGASCRKARQVARARLKQRIKDDGLQTMCRYENDAGQEHHFCKVGSWRCHQNVDRETCFASHDRELRWRWKDKSIG